MSEEFVTDGVGVVAPVDAFVRSILTGGAVSNGQMVADLYSPQLDHYFSIASRLTEAIDVFERPFKDGRVKDVLAHLPQEVQAAQALAANVGPVVQRVQGAEAATQAALSSVTLKFSDARVKDTLELLQLARRQLAAEFAFLETVKASLVVKASADGRFLPRIVAGSFVRRGDILGEFLQ